MKMNGEASQVFICSFNTAHKHRQHQRPPPPPTCGGKHLHLQLSSFQVSTCFRVFGRWVYCDCFWQNNGEAFCGLDTSKKGCGFRPPFLLIQIVSLFLLNSHHSAISAFQLSSFFPNLSSSSFSSSSSSWIYEECNLPQAFCERWGCNGACVRVQPPPATASHPSVTLVVGCISTQVSLVG